MGEHTKQATIISTALINADRYILAIRPDREIGTKIQLEQNEFALQYNSGANSITPFISIANFTAKESMESTLVRWLSKICSLQHSFSVTLNNYSGLPPHAIYLRVQDQEPVQRLAQQLKAIDEYLRANDCPSLQWVKRMRMDIAHQLSPAVYENALRDYSARLFFESFIATELILLRVDQIDEPPRLIHVFGFLPLENKLFN
ncbi:MAG: hypothetical protein H7Y31_17160 [Chitinophagaceae bacterium]|nr:hypothetical protein [Chitinophagaceae bacterium]